MERLDSRRLKSAAAESVSKSNYNPGKLVVIHTAVMLALSLAAWLIDFALEQQIGNTGGLGGVGMRSVLTTAQRVLQMAQVIALPFWKIGWVFAAMKIARGEDVGVSDLTQGFRRFAPFLRFMILRGLILFGVIFAATYASYFLVALTPLADAIASVSVSELSQMTEAELMAQFAQLIVPMMAVTAVLTIAFYIPFFYRFRMAQYFLLDNPKMGARAALRSGRNIMRGNLRKWIGLDLRFWWFWLLTCLVSLLGWADVILPMIGVEWFWAEEIRYLAAYLLAAAAQLTLYYFCKPKVDVTYAHAYMALLTEEKVYESH